MSAMNIIWLAAAGLFLFMEALTVGINFIWFSLGALAAMVTSFITDSVAVQIVVFVVVSVASLIALRPLLVKRFSRKKTEATNFDRIIGQTAVVTREIDNSKNEGQIMIFGQVWSASSESGDIIGKDVKVTVTDIRGVRAIVRPIV